MSETWNELTKSSKAHRYHAAVVVDDQIYAVGGEGVDAFERYDIDDDRWSELAATLPTARIFPAAAAIGHRIYVMGGLDDGMRPLASAEMYDIDRSEWSELPPLSIPRSRLAAVAVAGKVYAIGGLASDSNCAIVEEYDPGANTWTRKHDMPTPRHGHAAVACDGRILVIGGYGTSGTVLVDPLATVEEYDPATDTWRRRADIHTARGFLGAAIVGRYIYAIGGRTTGNTPVERYDPVADRWDNLPPASKQHQRFGLVSDSSAIYLVGSEEQPFTLLRFVPATGSEH